MPFTVFSSRPSKTVMLSGRPITVFGLSAEDPYFANSVVDDLDPEFTRVARMNVPRDATCIDIGANIGLKAMQLSHLAPKGRVIAVEAAPRVHKCLEVSIAANGPTNVAIEHAAITDRDGTVRFEDNSAFGHISQGGVEVPAMTLDALVQRHGLRRLDFVKIDVEGFEFPILRSSLPLFARHETIVCFEFNTWCMTAFTDDHPRICLEWLLSAFAEVYLLRRSNPPETQMERIAPDGALNMLAKNMIDDGHVSDIVVCTRPGKIRV